MATSIPEALSVTGVGGGITERVDFNNSQDSDSTAEIVSILYPKGATVFAAICASVFTIVGIGGKNLK